MINGVRLDSLVMYVHIYAAVFSYNFSSNLKVSIELYSINYFSLITKKSFKLPIISCIVNLFPGASLNNSLKVLEGLNFSLSSSNFSASSCTDFEPHFPKLD